ncbi:MgtC/SapB family protein [Hydrogenophaga defluvii]|uniref:MgtC/SapB family protein n=1 Tax=Hydrogenophaga defluvii TaxID=249410 RepID=A0ABW2SDP4_9BURK
MASPVISTEMLAVLATALGCGLLVGLDRERRKLRGPRRPLAGLRTFALTSVSGAAAMLSGQHALVAVGALLVVGLAVVGYLRNRTDDPGVTTEVALFLTYLIGVLCVVSLPLAAGLAVVLTALLTERETLHRFATEWLTPGEMRDGIILLTVVLIGLPLLPNRPLWGPVLNPQVIGQLLALLLALQSLAHLSRRLLAARQALALSSLASGFVSSTATVATLGMAVREGRGQLGAMAGAALISCVATLLQLLLVAAAVQAAWLPVLLWPSLAGALVALLWGAWLVRGAQLVPAGDAPAAGDVRMFSLPAAALIAALLTGIQAAVYGLSLWLGPKGMLAGTLLASLAELHSAVAAVMAATLPGDGQHPETTIALALVVHAASKCVNAGLTGGWRYALALAPGMLVHTGVVVGWLVWGR